MCVCMYTNVRIYFHLLKIKRVVVNVQLVIKYTDQFVPWPQNEASINRIHINTQYILFEH